MNCIYLRCDEKKTKINRITYMRNICLNRGLKQSNDVDVKQIV